MSKKLAPLFVLLSGVLWGSMGIFVRHYDAIGLTSTDIVMLRSLITVILLTIFLFIYDKKLFLIKLKDLWCFLGTGLCSILFFNLCYFKAITLTSLSVAAVLLYTAPAFVMALSALLFKEKLTVSKMISLPATFVGCALVTGIFMNTSHLSALGVLTGLGAGLGYALYSIFSRFALQRGYKIYTITFYTFLFATLGCLPFIHPQQVLQNGFGSWSECVYTLLFGLLSTVIPYLLYTVALQKVENTTASIIASIEPVVATLIGVLLFKEKLTVNIMVGMALVLGAILLCNIGTTKNKED